MRVFLNLMAGLDRVEAAYRVNDYGYIRANPDELACVIGKPGRFIKRDEAFAHVAGYSCYNEGSVREYQGHNRQFGLGKNFERSGSFGPWLMTPDEFGDPADHTLITRLSGNAPRCRACCSTCRGSSNTCPKATRCSRAM